MSQFYLGLSTGNLPPSVPTSFVTDDGTAIPAANILNVLGGPGIETYADPNLSNNLYIALANSCEGTTTTIDAAVSNITCLDLGATPGTYTFTTSVAAFTTAGGSLSAGYFITGCARTDGATATIIGIPDKQVYEEGALVAGDSQVSVSGNNLIIVCTGTLGYTVNWKEVTSAVFVS